MRKQHRIKLIFVTRSLVAIWLFLGCLALTDQMQLTQETSAQDEQALLQLASSLKPDVPHLEGALSGSVISKESVSLSLFATEGNANQETSCVLQAVPTLRLHQLVAVYRI
jgi:hypothetical protein